MCNDETLFIHVRSGDKGIVEEEFVKKIDELSKMYNNIVLLCRIHQNSERSHVFPSVTESIDNMNISLNKIIKNKIIIIDTSEPDIHLSIFRKSKNLLVHKGGFSILGALLFTGNNLYITNLFNPYQANNNNFLKIIKSPIVL